ncbi:hypothetical protein AALB16_10815, partial [Lachnospiraceae bacterium 62-35]
LTESANDFWKLLDPSRKAVLDQAGTTPSNLFTQEFNQDSGVFEIYARTYGLTSKEIAELEQIIKDNTDSLKGDLTDSIDMITYEAEQKARNAENKWKDFIPDLVSGMKAQGSFKDLEDPDLQDIAVKIVESLDPSYAAAMKAHSSDPYDYIREYFIGPMSGLSSDDKNLLTDTFNNLLKFTSSDLSDMPVDEVKSTVDSYMETINTILGGDSSGLNLKLNFDDLDTSDLEDDVKSKLKNEFSDKIDELTLSDLKIAAEQIKVSDGVLLSWDALIEKINEFKRSNSDNTPALSEAEMISEINKMSEGFESLDKIFKSISDKEPFDFKLLDDKTFEETFSGLGDAYTNFIKIISSNPEDIEACRTAFDYLLSTWLDSTGILDEVTEDTAELTIYMLSNMGVVNADELVARSLADSHSILSSAINNTAAASGAMSSASAKETEEVLKETTAADALSKSLSGVESDKISVNGVQINTSGDISQIKALANTADSAASSLRNLVTAKALAAGTAAINTDAPTKSAAANAALSQLQMQIKGGKYNPKAEYSGVNLPSTSNKGGGGSKKAAEDTEKEIDWIEHLQNILERKQKELESQTSSSFLSYLGLTEEEFMQAEEILSRTTQPIGQDLQKLADIASRAGIPVSELMDMIAEGGRNSRRGAFDALLKLDERTIEAGKQAVEKYKQQFEEASRTISPDILEKIMNGGIDIENYSGKEAENIQKAIGLFNKWQKAEAGLSESEKKRKQNILDGYNNTAEAFDKEIELSENHNQHINAEIGYLEESGQLVNASSYETILANLKGQETLLEKKLAHRRKELQDLLDSGEIKESSKEYYQLQGYIDECEESLIDLETEQEEYNNKLLQLPIENMEKVLDMYRSIQNEIENWGNVMEASGKKLDSSYYQTLIDNGMEMISQYQEQAELVRDVMDEYETGSDQWNKLYNQLTDIGSSISSMTQNLHEWNEELLRMPLASINTFTEELSRVSDSLNRIQDDYDTVISAVTTAISDYKDSLHEANEADNEAYQSKIDELQERLDLLNKQNEQLKLQTAYEQALYDLETANTQKTERVIRNGEIVYETNADNLRNAQESVQDALADLEEYKIKSEIDNLGDILDGINEKYNDQIEALDKISEKWEKIASDTEKAADNAAATEYLGDNWKDKVLSGNDLDLYTVFKSSYESNADMIHTYEEQITATENIYTLLEEYINSYREGTLTYEQAMKGIQGLLSQMNQVMSSGQNLQNVLDYLALTNGTDADTGAVLEGIQKSLSDSSDELLENMKQYNENLDLIAGCMTSWETLVDNTNQMVDLLEEVRDNLEDALDEMSRRDDDDDDDDDSHYTTNGGTAPRHDKNDWGSDTEGPGKDLHYADGIEKGLVGRSGPSSRENTLKTLAGRELDPKEFPAMLHYHEAIFNEEQQQMLIKNLQGAYAAYPPMQLPNCIPKSLPSLSSRLQPPSYHVSMGDVNVQGVKNVEEFINSMATLSSQALRQQFSKGF